MHPKATPLQNHQRQRAVLTIALVSLGLWACQSTMEGAGGNKLQDGADSVDDEQIAGQGGSEDHRKDDKGQGGGGGLSNAGGNVGGASTGGASSAGGSKAGSGGTTNSGGSRSGGAGGAINSGGSRSGGAGGAINSGGSQGGAAAGGAAVPVNGATWKSCDPFTLFKSGGFMFNNQRWNGEQGCISVDTRGPIAYETTHTNFQACCSSPWVSIGWTGLGDAHADNDSLPIQLKDIEVLKANWRFTIPTPLKPGYSSQAFHVYFQIYLGKTPGADRSAGDIALTMYDSWFYRQPKFSDTVVTIGDYTLESKNVGDVGFGPFEVMVVTNATPDTNGTLEIRNFDIKASIDLLVKKGTYSPELYLNHVSAAFEVMTLPGGILKTNDLAFAVKSKGKPLIITPPWVSPNWTPR